MIDDGGGERTGPASGARWRAAVLTVSDRAAAGLRDDASGREACEWLERAGLAVDDPVIVSDERGEIAAAIRRLARDCALVVTTGGTGLAPRDVTPEATRDVLEREAPGIAERLRRKGEESTPHAALSRGVAGTLGACLVVNLPGSPKAVREGLEALAPMLRHALEILGGADPHG